MRPSDPIVIVDSFGQKSKAIWTVQQSLFVPARSMSGHVSSRMEKAIMKIVVIGGSGPLGSKVVANLRQNGHQVIAAAPNTGVNTITGEGLAEALAGAQI